MLTDVLQFVKGCDTCFRCKGEHYLSPGLLQPLPIPQQAWQHISMDFIEHLPKSKEKDTILIVLCRFTKCAHFIGISHPFSASIVAKVFLDTVFRLHGAPQSIVSDRDKLFTSLFWRDLFKCLGIQLAYSSAYHPQSDGQMES